ncbi:MAG: DNA translocase FtsK 4TM domain-containing protein [Chitinophagaceae bacterium]|nr:DNA translocase FtsK 4TM domain-containing protein [Chitinophagaceae bacterium]
MMTDHKLQTTNYKQPIVISLFAKFFSWLFHPLFIPLIVVYFIVYIHPSYLSGFNDRGKMQVLMIVTLNAVFFPLLTVLLLKGVGFIQSVFLRTQKDRIIPYIACSIFYFWTYHVFRQQHQFPPVLPAFFFGALIASSAALMANIYYKVSMHAIGMGGLIGLFIVIMNSNTMLMTWPLSIALLIAGIVCTSRLIVSNHTNKDIYMGLIIGVGCQLAAGFIIT